MKLDNYRILRELDVITPRQLRKAHKLSPEATARVFCHRSILLQILNGTGSKCIIMTGPCSIHNHYSAKVYAQRLKTLSDKVSDSIFIIMRTYFEKPRTTVGWKGLIADPRLNGTDDLNAGLILARKILCTVCELDIPTVTEFLGPIIPQYISDLITTGTVGARTTESQTHREMASGLSMPVGFKNSTDGSVPDALNACITARSPHTFLGINLDGQIKLMATAGNPDGYLIMRGGKNGTNFDAGSIAAAQNEITKKSLSCKIIVDCSHENSGKKHVNQNVSFRSVLDQIVKGNPTIAGMMLESNLHAGRQEHTPNKPLKDGISITDECIGWEETESLILEAHERLKGKLN